MSTNGDDWENEKTMGSKMMDDLGSVSMGSQNSFIPDVSSFKSSFGLGGMRHKKQLGQFDSQFGLGGM